MGAFSRRTQAVLESIECIFKLYAYTYRINLGWSNDPFGVWLDIHDHIRQLVYLCHNRSGLFLGRNQEGPVNVSSCIKRSNIFIYSLDMETDRLIQYAYCLVCYCIGVRVEPRDRDILNSK